MLQRKHCFDTYIVRPIGIIKIKAFSSFFRSGRSFRIVNSWNKKPFSYRILLKKKNFIKMIHSQNSFQDVWRHTTFFMDDLSTLGSINFFQGHLSNFCPTNLTHIRAQLIGFKFQGHFSYLLATKRNLISK